MEIPVLSSIPPCSNLNVGRNFKIDSARCFLLSVAVTRSTFRVCVFVCAGVRELVRRCEMCDKKGTPKTYRSQSNGSSTCFHLGFYCANIGVGKKFRNMFSSASTHIRKGSQKEQRKHSQKKLCQALQAAGQSHFVHALVETQAKLLPSVRLLDLGILSKNRQSPIRAHNF